MCTQHLFTSKTHEESSKFSAHVQNVLHVQKNVCLELVSIENKVMHLKKRMDFSHGALSRASAEVGPHTTPTTPEHHGAGPNANTNAYFFSWMNIPVGSDAMLATALF